MSEKSQFIKDLEAKLEEEINLEKSTISTVENELHKERIIEVENCLTKKFLIAVNRGIDSKMIDLIINGKNVFSTIEGKYWAMRKSALEIIGTVSIILSVLIGMIGLISIFPALLAISVLIIISGIFSGSQVKAYEGEQYLLKIKRKLGFGSSIL